MVLGSGVCKKYTRHEGRIPMNRISAFIRSPRKLFRPFHHVRTQWKDSYELSLWWGRGSSSDTESADALVLDFTVSIIGRNKCLLFISHSMIFCYSNSDGLRHLAILLHFPTFLDFKYISSPLTLKLQHLISQTHSFIFLYSIHLFLIFSCFDRYLCMYLIFLHKDVSSRKAGTFYSLILFLHL